MTRLHEIVLQYNVLYCGWKGVHEAKLYRNTKLFCDRKARQLGRRGRWGVQAWALGRAGLGALARRRTDARVAGEQQLGVGAGGRQRRAGRARQGRGSARQGRDSARQARGLGAGRAAGGAAGWLWVVHSVHSSCFRSGLTRYCS